MVLQWPRLFPANLGNWNDSLVVTSTLCLTFGLLLAQFVWNCNALLWSFLYWGKGKVQSYKTTYYITNSHNSDFKLYTHSSSLSKGLSVRSVLTLRKRLLLYLFLSFQWNISMAIWLPAAVEKQFEDRLTFPLFSSTACSAFPNYRISSIHSAPLVPCKHLWYWTNLTINPYSLWITGRRGVCGCFCVASLLCPWMGFAVGILDW